MDVQQALMQVPEDFRAVMILHDVHDCADVLAWLRGDGPEPVAKASYVRVPGAAPVRVEPGIVPLLRVFGTGRSPDEVSVLLGGTPSERWLPDLVGFGLLVPADA